MPEGFEEIEVVTPVDIWRRAGIQVVIASLSSKRHVSGRNGITLRADASLASISPDANYDLLFIPGGPGVSLLRASPEVREHLEQHYAADRWIAAICAAPLVLHDAGLLAGRRYTAHPATETELTHILAHERVITDGRIITSRGAGTALDLALAVITVLIASATAENIATNICA